MSKEIYERSATIERKGENGQSTYTVSLSSEYPVERWGVTEILEHSESAINMERARNGLVLLFNHNENNPIGRINNLSIRADKKLMLLFLPDFINRYPRASSRNVGHDNIMRPL